jgi:hypothetical protein
MPVMFSNVVPVFLSVTNFAALVVFTMRVPKDKLVADKLTAAAVPVPDRATVCGLPVALSVTVIVPGWLPVAVGVNVTVMEQLAPAATEAPQVLVSAYWVLATMLVMLSAVLPELVSVMVCAALVVFRF